MNLELVEVVEDRVLLVVLLAVDHESSVETFFRVVSSRHHVLWQVHDSAKKRLHSQCQIDQLIPACEPVAEEGVLCVEVHDQVGHDFLGQRRLFVFLLLFLFFA